MEGARGRGVAAAILAAAMAAAGCCLPEPEGTSALRNRDTPEAAFEFFRAAFAGDRPGDQFDCFHPDFVEEQGLSASRYVLARSLAPGTFARATRLLGAAVLEGEPEHLVARTDRGEFRAARLRLSTPEGTGTFLLLDRPRWEASLSDPDLPALGGPVADVGRAARIEGGRLLVSADLPLDFPPAPGTAIRRVTIHHDWLLWRIEALEGFEEFLGEVKAAEESAKEGPR